MQASYTLLDLSELMYKDSWLEFIRNKLLYVYILLLSYTFQTASYTTTEISSLDPAQSRKG